MSRVIQPVSVNASGSRDDIPTARNVARVREVHATGRDVRPVLDGPPYDSSCRAIMVNGEKCGNPIKSDREREGGACYRHYWRQ